MNEELQQYYNYLKQAKADVPDTFESFQSTLSDEGSAKQYYSYLREKGFDAPDTFDSFSNTLGLKKKGYSVESLEQGENPFQSIGIKSQPSSTPQPQSPSAPSEPIGADLSTPNLDLTLRGDQPKLANKVSDHIINALSARGLVTKKEYENRIADIDKRLGELPETQPQLADVGFGVDPFVSNTPEDKERESLLTERRTLEMQLTTPSTGEYITGRALGSSLVGMASAIMNGDKGKEVLSNELQWLEKNKPGTMADVTATVLGFTLDAPAFSGLGGLGKVAAKPLVGLAMKRTANQFVKAGFSEAVAKKLVAKGAERLTSTLVSGTQLGGYGFTADALSQWSQPDTDFDDIRIGQSLERGGKDFLLGLGVGTLGIGQSYLANKIRAVENGTLRAATQAGTWAGALSAESALFAYGGALMEGKKLREVKSEDFLHTLALIGTLKVQGAIQHGKATLGGLYRSMKYDPAKVGQGEFKVEMEPWEIERLGGKDYQSLMTELSKNDTKLGEILKDKDVPAILKQKVLWGSRGVALDKVGFRVANITTQGNDVEMKNEYGVLLDRRRFANQSEADKASIRLGLRLDDAQKQAEISSSPNKIKIIREFRNKGGNVESLLLALDKDAIDRTPEESKMVGSYYDLVDKVESGIEKEQHQAVKDDIDRRKAELKVQKDKDLSGAKTPEATQKINDEFTAKMNELELELKENIVPGISMGKTQMYGKKNVIDAMLEGETEEMKDVMRSELANMDEAEFNDMAKQAGFDRIGNHWVGAKIPSSLESVQTTKKEGEKVAKEEGKRLPLEEKTEMDLQTPQKYTINKGSSDLPQAPELSKEDINWEESNWENIEDIGKIRLLETRGRNTKGQLVGTVRIIGKERGAETVEVVFNERSNKPILNRNTNLLGGGKGNAEQREESTSLLKEESVKENKDFTPDNEIGGQENAKGGRTENSEVSSEVTPRVEQGEENISDVRNNAKEGTTEEVAPPKEQTSPSRAMYDKMEELHNSVQEAMEPVKEKKSILQQDTDLLGQEKEDAMNVVTPQERRRVGDVVKYKDKDGNILEGSYRGVAGNNQALIEHSESKNGIKYNATILRPMEEVEFPKTMPNDQMRAVDYALENNLYQEWIKEGRMTAQDAKIIIESAGLDVPSDISEIAQEKGGRRTVRAKAEELRKFNEENGTLYNDFKEIFNQLREKGEEVFKTIGPCP